MKKVILSSVLAVLFVVYAISVRTTQPNDEFELQPPDDDSPDGTTPAVSNNTSRYKDGSYTGRAADAFYGGKIQVNVTIANGVITAVDFLDYPQDRPTSIRINKAALPLFEQEALEAQSGDVDVVSGATQSSLAFRESLNDALRQAEK